MCNVVSIYIYIHTINDLVASDCLWNFLEESSILVYTIVTVVMTAIFSF